MTPTMMTDRTNFAAAALCKPAAAMPMMPASGAMCVVPRCRIQCEMCQDGCKISCSCDDQVACGTLQNLCRALAGDTCCVVCSWNGMTLCQCNFTCCHCRCEMTKDGCSICCTTGDKACCKMIQAMCECINCCRDNGCCCMVCFGSAPVCCGTC